MLRNQQSLLIIKYYQANIIIKYYIKPLLCGSNHQESRQNFLMVFLVHETPGLQDNITFV